MDIGELLSSLGGFLTSNMGDLLQGGVSAYGYKNLMDDFESQRGDVNAALGQTRQDVLSQGTFQPYSVRSAIGSTVYDPATGTMQNTLSQPQQQFSDLSRTRSNDMFARATADPAQRETDIFNRIRAMQAPDEQRAYNTMNSNLFSSGRGGMMTGDFGGSPEQFAFGKAQAEARNAASLAAMGQAQNEMMNYANIGSTLGQQQYLPYNTLSGLGQQGIFNQQIRTQAGSNLANVLAQLGVGGATTDVNFANVRGGAFGELIKALGGALGGIGN